MTEDLTEQKTLWLGEYQAANDLVAHYDSYTWLVGSIFIAGVFAFWGFALPVSETSRIVWIAGIWLAFFIMTMWWLYACHNRYIYRFKLHRLHELETILKFEQHRRFVEPGIYNVPGPKGHIINLLLYFVLVMFGPAIGLVRNWANSTPLQILAFLPVALMLGVLFMTYLQERKVTDIVTPKEGEGSRPDGST